MRISYEPAAIGFGEAPISWTRARAQRARWLRGTRDTSRQFLKRLFLSGVQQRDPAILDGATQAILPSYSTLSLLSLGFLTLQVLINYLVGSVFPASLVFAWVLVAGTLLIYPLFGLALEHAPRRAYLAILLGPYFILWRTWLAFRSRFLERDISWVRTEHGS